MNSVKKVKNRKKATEWISELSFAQLPKIKDVAFIKDEIVFALDDGRIYLCSTFLEQETSKGKTQPTAKFQEYRNPCFLGRCG